MDINLTLVGQLITFAIVVWFTMRYIWPPLTKALTQRQKQISEGLIAAEEAYADRTRAKEEALQIVSEARAEAAQIIEQSHKRGNLVIEQARADAQIASARLISAAHSEIERDMQTAQEQLRAQLAQLVVQGAEKILKREINPAANQDLINDIMQAPL